MERGDFKRGYLSSLNHVFVGQKGQIYDLSKDNIYQDQDYDFINVHYT